MKKSLCCCIFIAVVSIVQAQVNFASYSYTDPTTIYKDGKLTGFFPSGDTQFVCECSKDVMNGVWRSYYPGGQICDSGRMKKNAPDGLWKSWYPSGQLRMEAEFSAKYFSVAKTLLDRTQDKKFDGVVPAISGMSNDIALKARVDSNTVKETSDYDLPFECMNHGLYKTYFPNGLLRDSGYVDEGDREGVWQEWDSEKNMKLIGFYRKGLRCREWQYYDSHGKLLFIERYTSEGAEKERVTLR